jgi:hypothetical protein
MEFKLSQIISIVKLDFQSYKESNLISDPDLYRWAYDALSDFAGNLSYLQESIVEVKNGFATLPKNFISLYFAVKCSPRGYHAKEEDQEFILSSEIYRERTEKGCKWNSCDPCCEEEVDKVITEKVYIKGRRCDFYYDCPEILCLTKGVKRSLVNSKCANLWHKGSKHEINIIGKQIQANFSNGNIYLQYYGLDEIAGDMLIPDYRELRNYIEYYLKYKLVEKLVTSEDIANASLLSYYSQKTKEAYTLAASQIAWSKITPSTFRKLETFNRQSTFSYDCAIPNPYERGQQMSYRPTSNKNMRF